MADYRKMYAILCKAVDDVIDTLESIPLARPSAVVLQDALLKAEDVYIGSSVHMEDIITLPEKNAESMGTGRPAGRPVPIVRRKEEK